MASLTGVTEPVGVAMSFAKALDLLRLAEMAAARHMGVSLSEIEAEFGVDRRTAQRMTRALEAAFDGVETLTDDARRRYWRLRADPRQLHARGLRDSELAALGLAIRRAERDGATHDVAALSSLRDRLLGSMPAPHARRAETDAEALLEAQGWACRPGPVVPGDPALLPLIAQALKAPNRMTIRYRGADGALSDRRIEPYGVLFGTRRYLVARDVLARDARLRHFRLDRIAEARLEADSFVRDPDFRLEDHAARAFGSYHDPAEYGPVVWRFAPQAAATAREFLFHPRQETIVEPDGALTVRFQAGGWLEMAWHLYQWGDAVEVLEPEPLRRMVEGHRRGDLPALP
ncbi:YafY family protein [Tabrizicola sp. YIM 78059]|uniref:helix-turn-helix transcriptional regulator n=1 Tax=Tabrizicola sp. YIM 78059 TaxID=2529861 RepID=UPI0020BD5E6B|nr:WYL domain-containing protein [Tabrizicola sp. YIM 78059]